MSRFAAVLFLATLAGGALPAAPIRGTAVVDLGFNEKAGPASDRAIAGLSNNPGALVSGARRVPSPFGATGRAVLLDQGRKQFVQLVNSPDTARRRAATVSMLLVNLHGPADAGVHGLFAKRSVGKDATTNYGINFVAKSDVLQLYVNDGTGFRIAKFSFKRALGSRRRVHLVATIRVGDAPAADQDTEADDLRLRLFSNGQPVPPAAAPQKGIIEGNDAWLLDVKAEGLLTPAPLTLGASTTASEYFTGVIDEVQLFDRELTPADVSHLFTEVAGPRAAEQFARDIKPRPALPPAPRLTAVSLRGLQVGQVTRVVLNGQHLGSNPSLLSTIGGTKTSVVQGSNAGMLILDVTLPADAIPGIYPVRVATSGGISNPITLAVDRLPQKTQSVLATPEQAVPVPVAVSGLISGSEVARSFVRARKGQRLVADVESRRLGGTCEPVVEIKNAQGTPLAIEWSQVPLRGDARAEITVPADGIYIVEIHDLSYKAPAKSPFRVKIGDLVLVDSVFPPAANAGGPLQVTPIGTGLAETDRLTVDLTAAGAQTGTLVAGAKLAGPAPVLQVTRGTEVVEPTKPGQVIDARFSGKQLPPLMISGRVLVAGEVDRFSLDVTPGQKLRLQVDGRSINSPIDAELTVLVAGKPVASSQDRAGSRDPQLDFTVPDKTTRIEIAVKDLYDRGAAQFLYRLRVSPQGRPDFSLVLQSPNLFLPRVGSATARLQVNRAGYNGPIRLRVVGDDQVGVSPTHIPAGIGGTVFVTLVRAQGGDASSGRSLALVGSTVGQDPPIERVARVSGQSVPGHDSQWPVALAAPQGVALDVVAPPTALYRGLPAVMTIQARATERGRQGDRAVRISSMSNEPLRPIDPKNRGKGNRPIARIAPNQATIVDGGLAAVTMVVPSDMPGNQVDVVLVGDILAHAYASAVEGRITSRPMRIPVRNAVSVTLDAKTLSLPNNSVHEVKGTLKRDPGFQGPVLVEIAVDGKKAPGYRGGQVLVPAGVSNFSIRVVSGTDAKPRVLPGSQLIVRAASGGPTLLPPQGIQLKSAPKPASK